MKKKNIFNCALVLCSIALSNNINCQEIDSSKNIININSDPIGAEIFLNNSFIGKTPFTLTHQTPGKFKILIKLDNRNSYSEVVNYSGDKVDIYPLFNKDYSILDILTFPDSASIFLNDSLCGATPMYDLKIPLGLNEIKIEKEDYIQIKRSYNFQRKKIKWNYNLNYKYGFITFSPGDLNIKLSIHDSLIYESDIKNLKTLVGDTKFESKLENWKSISKVFKIEPNKYYNLRYRTDYFTPVYMLESMVMPGFGQFQDNSKIKGASFFLTTLAFGYLYVNENANYKSKSDNYNNAKINYMESLNEQETIQLRTVMNQALDQVNSSVQKKNIYLGCIIGVYILNILDAFIFHTEGFDMDLIEITNDNLDKSSHRLEFNYPLN